MKKEEVIKNIELSKKEIEFYNNLFESLSWEELLSLEKSNSMTRSLRKQLKIYKAFRIIKEAIPIIATIAISSVVMGTIKKILEKEN